MLVHGLHCIFTVQVRFAVLLSAFTNISKGLFTCIQNIAEGVANIITPEGCGDSLEWLWEWGGVFWGWYSTWIFGWVRKPLQICWGLIKDKEDLECWILGLYWNGLLPHHSTLTTRNQSCASSSCDTQCLLCVFKKWVTATYTRNLAMHYSTGPNAFPDCLHLSWLNMSSVMIHLQDGDMMTVMLIPSFHLSSTSTFSERSLSFLSVGFSDISKGWVWQF